MTAEDKPNVLIVGAGIGGLLLGALLEKAQVPYTIFERTSSVKPLGKWCASHNVPSVAIILYPL
jgi:cation diffusion facilitator CzcD-associated flavoprotein CzcO